MSDNIIKIAAGSPREEQATLPPSFLHQQRSDTQRHSTKYSKARRQQAMWAYLFIAPFCLVFLLFNVGPYIYSFVLSFQHYAGFGIATPAGISNYTSILQYHVFWTELWNTIFYWLAHAIPLIPLAFFLAFLIRSRFIKGQRFWKPLIFLPQVMTIVAVSLVFQTLFSTQYGVVNQLFHLHIAWLEEYSITRWVVVLLLIWQGLGFWFVVFLAGLTSIDTTLEEAAIVDGASVWQRLWYIIIPLMRNIFLFAFAIDAIGSMRLYTQPNVLVSRASLADPSIAPVLNLLVGNLQGGSFGQSAAVGWLLFIVTIFITAIMFGIFRATGGD